MNQPIEPSLEERRVTSGESPVAARGKPRRRTLLWLGLLALVAVAAYVGYQRFIPAPAAQPPASGRPGGPAGPTPVVAVPAGTSDIDVFLNGLGTATPLRTVAVKTRVSGQLMRVNFQEGQLVKEGQVLAEIDPRPFQVQLTQAEGQMARDRALLENARLDLERYRTLFGQDSIAKQQVDTQAALVRQYEGAVKVDQSQIDNAKLQLVYARITAPITGRAGLRQVDPGNMVTGSETNGIVVLTQLQPITVVFSIPQDSVSAVMKRVQSGDKLPVEAWDRELKTRLATGVLASVDNLVDTATGTVKLRAQFANEDNALFPNQFVNVRMKLDTLRDAIVVPTAAIQRGAQGSFVYVVKADQTVGVRTVKPGTSDGPRTAIVEGLSPGEVVVIDGMDRLREGARVEVTQRPEFRAPADGQAHKGVRRRPPAGEGAAPPRPAAK
jgi:multidrug efflux system membrane fusion protein